MKVVFEVVVKCGIITQDYHVVASTFTEAEKKALAHAKREGLQPAVVRSMRRLGLAI